MLLKKKSLVERLSKKGYTKKDAGIIIEDVAKTIVEALVDGDSVLIHGFGTFSTKTMAPRETRDIYTGELIQLPEIHSVKFTPGKFLKRCVREGRIDEEIG